MTYLAPQAVPIAVPVGLLLSLLYGLRGTALAFKSAAAILILRRFAR